MASHTYADNGSYMAKLTVNDGKGGSNAKTVAVSVTNVAPTAAFANSAPVDEGTSFGLSLSSVVDPGSLDVAAGFTFTFDCGGGAGYGAYSGSASATCTTADNATRTVRGKVRDKDGGESEYVAWRAERPTCATGTPDRWNAGDDQRRVLGPWHARYAHGSAIV
jgi:PKD repeat protein